EGDTGPPLRRDREHPVLLLRHGKVPLTSGARAAQKEIGRVFRPTVRCVMECHRFKDLIGDYYDHRLPEDRRSAFENHLVGCSECQRTLSDWAEIAALAKSLPAVKAPENFEAEIRRKIQEGAASSNGWMTFWHWLAGPKLPVAALAAILVLLIGGAVMMQKLKNNPADPVIGVEDRSPDVSSPTAMPNYVDVLLKGSDNE